MLDFFNIEKYKENNRLEAKAAAVGLPKSLWATYSAFANTNGGIILLGVTEDAQHQLHVEGVNDADALVIDFWNIINNQSKISINVLNDKDVIVREFDGKKIIIISVPRAQRYDKPITLMVICFRHTNAMARVIIAVPKRLFRQCCAMLRLKHRICLC